MTDPFQSALVEVELAPEDFMEFAARAGWGDGLPLVPPTTDRVAAMLAGTTRDGAEVIASLPPLNGDCTVEKVAINAVMAGAPASAMPLLCAAIEAIADPKFELAGVMATTGSVIPALFLNGPIIERLGLTTAEGCFGGAADASPAIGRAFQLILRNVAGQLVGVTSQSVFGQPGRVTGLLVPEAESQSPWAPLAERRGVAGDALTVFGSMGTMNICDTTASTGYELLKIIGASVATPGANGFLVPCPRTEAIVAINPVWASIIAKDFRSIDEVQIVLWEQMSRPVAMWPEAHQRALADVGRVDDAGLVHLCPSPDDVLVMVCGGSGSLHSMTCHSWGNTGAVTVSIRD